MKAKQRQPIDWNDALRLREVDGWSFADIAREFDYAYKTVREALHKRGAHGRKRAISSEAARKLREVWRVTREKCERVTHHLYASFGGRGARVSKEWSEFEPFYRWARASGYRPGLRLVRIRPAGEFGPRNCRWVSALDHARMRARPTGPRRRHKTPVQIDWAEAIRLLREDGLSRREIADKFGASYTGIVAGLHRRSVAIPKRAAATSTPDGKRLRHAWDSMLRSCTDPAHPRYPYHGGRGTHVAREWATFEPFLRWARTSGSRPGLCLTRIDSSKDFGPENCEWVSTSELLRRRKPPTKAPRPRRLVTAFGETKGLVAWSRDPRCTVSPTAIAGRLARGWGVKDAISTPAENAGGAGMFGSKLAAFGQSKSVAEWLLDRRCKVRRTGIADRLRRGWTPEAAISTPAFREPRKAPPAR